MLQPDIVFEDEHIAVVFKPAGMLSEDSEDEPNVPSFLRERTGGEIYPVHRLDKTTQGLMVYAKNRAAAAALSEAVRTGRLKKIYTAVAEGVTDKGGTLTDLLFYDRKKGKSYVVSRERGGVKRAELSFERIGTGELNGESVSLLKITLRTGRTHQIRAQFASRRHPLAGDRRYGSRIRTDGIALCASELSFRHPVTGEELSFTAEPVGEAFKAFDPSSQDTTAI